ncbi:hypothetical protein DAEQUDRAFT_768911 [Daedalea quercina L-15889]|uniref:Uncharacterized protein n=1 Tax=Daedalea quercina L-15889 TaxID=1314783 RepID=A0A165M822_9APHY|nr:hypothetical protein DAEQUDRAFT_768911 [Daedalea quercina L-15889]
MSLPVQRGYEREFDGLMAREPIYGRIGTVIPHFRRPVARAAGQPANQHQQETVPHGLAAGITGQLLGPPAGHSGRSLPDDELEARGWFSAIKGGVQGIESIKSAHDNKKQKKKQGKREYDDIYEREFYDYD